MAKGMSSDAGPTYNLDLVKRLVQADGCDISYEAMDGIYAMGLTSEDVQAAIGALHPTQFYKTMPATKMPDAMQDVYFTNYQRRHIYLKLQIVTLRRNGLEVVRVISFKRNERYDSM